MHCSFLVCMHKYLSDIIDKCFYFFKYPNTIIRLYADYVYCWDDDGPHEVVESSKEEERNEN